MVNKLKKWASGFSDGFIAILIIILLVVLVYGISWIFTCGLIKVITLCFGWKFSWGIATGIWFIILLLKSIFSVNVKTK